MFEGKPHQPRNAQADEGSPPASEGLRALTWSDLRARLDAARDLRTDMVSKVEDRLSSFDAYSASRIAAQSNGKEAVYPDDLTNCKGPGRKKDSTSASDGDCASEPGN